MEILDSDKYFVLCIKNDDYEASLEIRKIYYAIIDEKASRYSLIRVIDESDEDYLYPKDYFIPIELPQNIIEAISRIG